MWYQIVDPKERFKEIQECDTKLLILNKDLRKNKRKGAKKVLKSFDKKEYGTD